jgi:hypothetical protein
MCNPKTRNMFWFSTKVNCPGDGGLKIKLAGKYHVHTGTTGKLVKKIIVNLLSNQSSADFNSFRAWFKQ